MMNARKQRGLTMISWMLVAAVAAFLGTFAFKLLPIYMEHARINSVLDGTAAEYEGVSQRPGRQDLKRAVDRRIGVNDVRAVSKDDLQFSQDDGTFMIGFTFQQQTEFMGNISLLVSYDYWVQIGS